MIVGPCHSSASLHPDARPAFLITMDTEGDNLWAAPREITTRNSRFLPRFQGLCEKYGFKPTWLTNYEMACCGNYREFARDAQKRGTGEIGMHLHAWNSPPIVPLTDDDFYARTLLIHYPERVMRDKIGYITDLLEQVFETKMTSHRAGRWGFDEVYARLLLERGYLVDCSVTPLIAWSKGSDYTNFPDEAYFLDPKDISKAAPEGTNTLLELPVTVVAATAFLRTVNHMSGGLPSIVRRVVARLAPPVTWLRPNGRNLAAMLRLLKQSLDQKRPFVEFMLHSSELMPGGSPHFGTDAKIERLYEDMERLFSAASSDFRGATLTEYAQGLPESAR